MKTEARTEVIHLGPKDSVPNPACFRSDGSSCLVYGPGIVHRITYPDGGITLKIVEGCRE